MHDPKSQHPFTIVADKVFETPMYFVTAMVNGDMARDLLQYNKEPVKGQQSTNRKASKVVVDDYAAVMVQGGWYLSPQPIIFSDKNPDLMSGQEFEEMLDGQQRLKALIQASGVQPGIEVPFTLCFDAPSAAKWLLDMGKKRLPSDFFRMQGEVDPGSLAKAVKMLYALDELQPFRSINLWRSVKLTPQEQTMFLAKHPALRTALTRARDTKTLFSNHVGAVLFYMVHREFGIWRAQELFRALKTGADISTDDARLKVREFLAMKRADKYKWDGFEQLAVLIAAANAWLTGQGEDYKARSVFGKLSTSFPRLRLFSEMPKTTIVPGNDPNLDSRNLPERG